MWMRTKFRIILHGPQLQGRRSQQINQAVRVRHLDTKESQSQSQSQDQDTFASIPQIRFPGGRHHHYQNAIWPKTYGQKRGEMTAAGHEGEAAAGQAGEPLVSSSQWPNPRAPQWPVSLSSISPRPGVDLVAVIVRAFSNFPAGPGEAGSSASWGPLSSVRQEEQQQQPASAINLARSNKWTKHSKEYYLCFFFRENQGCLFNKNKFKKYIYFSLLLFYVFNLGLQLECPFLQCMSLCHVFELL